MRSLPKLSYKKQKPTFMPAKTGIVGGIFSFTRPHLFHMLTGEGVASMFLKTIASDIEQARAFVSKKSSVDLDAIKNIIGQSVPQMIELKKAVTDDPLLTGLKTRSILLDSCILHFHMVKEPDQHGEWKIYGVDKECR